LLSGILKHYMDDLTNVEMTNDVNYFLTFASEP